MATNDGMVRKVGWWLVSQREKVFSCGTAVSGWWCKVQVRIAEHVLSLWTRRRGEDDGGDQGGEQQAAKNPLWKKGSP